MPSRQIIDLSQKGNRRKLSWWPDLEDDGLAHGEALLGELHQELLGHSVSVVVVLGRLALVEKTYIHHLKRIAY